MDTIFKYYQGSLEEFITDVKNTNDNRLMKKKLIPGVTYYKRKKKLTDAKS